MLQTSTAACGGTSVCAPGVFVTGRECSPGNVAVDSLWVVVRPSVLFAWLQADQSMQARRGENAGETLHDEFIVHAIQSAQKREIDGARRASCAVSAKDAATNQGAVVWVSDADGQPDQATDRWSSVSRRAQARSN